MLGMDGFACFQIRTGRHKGSWKAVAQLRDDAGLKLRPKQIQRRTEQEARKAMEEWIRKNGRLIPSPSMTVEAMCDAYLARCEARGRAQKTIEDYRKIKAAYVTHTIGHIQISKLKPAHVEAMMEGLPSKAAVNARAFLRAAINKVARKADPDLPNVAAIAEPPSYSPAPTLQLTPENFEKILEQERDPMRRAMWLLLSDTGIRPHDEAGCLTWFEIHKREDGWWIKLADSKTEEGKKPVPISETTKAALEALPRTSRYVFPSDRKKGGTPFHERTWRDWWTEAQIRAEVPVTNIYQLRHFFGTVQAGKVKRHVLARLMRHTDPRTSERYYVDPFDADLRKSKQ